VTATCRDAVTGNPECCAPRMAHRNGVFSSRARSDPEPRRCTGRGDRDQSWCTSDVASFRWSWVDVHRKLMARITQVKRPVGGLRGIDRIRVRDVTTGWMKIRSPRPAVRQSSKSALDQALPEPRRNSPASPVGRQRDGDSDPPVVGPGGSRCRRTRVERLSVRSVPAVRGTGLCSARGRRAGARTPWARTGSPERPWARPVGWMQQVDVGNP
jgi:hypothetical protein